MITLTNVSFSYPQRRRYRDYLLKPLGKPERSVTLIDVSMTIQPGTRIAILGPNGAGKTTLLKLIGGLLYPTSGTVRIDGASTTQRRPSTAARVGYVINEERSFYWRLSGRDNLLFFGMLDDLLGEQAIRRVDQLLQDVGLGPAATKLVSDYSAGMRQRLAIARGLLTDPDVLLLDEPTKSLDISGAVEIRELLRNTAQSNARRALVVTTNQPGDVTSLCERAFVLSGKRVHPLREFDIASDAELVTKYRRHMAEAV